MNPTTFLHPQPQRGNILVIILVAIALLAALSMTVMRSDVTDADGVAPEQARIIASQISAQGRNLEQAVRATIGRGCSEQQVNFVNTVVAGYTNATAPSDKSCDLFAREGAGLSWPTPPGNANDGSAWRMMAGNAVTGVTNTDDGSCSSGCIDLLAVLPNVTLNVCKQLNALAGVTTASESPPIDAGNFDGTTKIAGFNAAAVGVPVGDAGALLTGKPSGCFEATNIDSVAAPGTYWYYHVLLVR
jgi:Tfp pilus assembly protein PilX